MWLFVIKVWVFSRAYEILGSDLPLGFGMPYCGKYEDVSWTVKKLIRKYLHSQNEITGKDFNACEHCFSFVYIFEYIYPSCYESSTISSQLGTAQNLLFYKAGGEDKLLQKISPRMK